MAHYGESEVARLLQDTGIVRHRGKIEALMPAADRAVRLQAQCGSLRSISGATRPAGP